MRRLPGFGEIPVRIPATQPNISDFFSKTNKPSTVTKPEQSNSNDTGYDTSPSSPEDIFSINSQSTDSRVKVEVFSPGTKSSKSSGSNKNLNTSTLSGAKNTGATTSKSADSVKSGGKPLISLTSGIADSSPLNHAGAFVLCDSDDELSLVQSPAPTMIAGAANSSQTGNSAKRKRPKPTVKMDGKYRGT